MYVEQVGLAISPSRAPGNFPHALLPPFFYLALSPSRHGLSHTQSPSHPIPYAQPAIVVRAEVPPCCRRPQPFSRPAAVAVGSLHRRGGLSGGASAKAARRARGGGGGPEAAGGGAGLGGVVEAWAAAHLLEEDDGRTEERKKESSDLSWIWRVK